MRIKIFAITVVVFVASFIAECALFINLDLANYSLLLFTSGITFLVGFANVSQNQQERKCLLLAGIIWYLSISVAVLTVAIYNFDNLGWGRILTLLQSFLSQSLLGWFIGNFATELV